MDVHVLVVAHIGSVRYTVIRCPSVACMCVCLSMCVYINWNFLLPKLLAKALKYKVTLFKLGHAVVPWKWQI